MKTKRRRIGRLRAMSYGMFIWMTILPSTIFFMLSPSCSMIAKKTPEKYIESARRYAEKKDYKRAIRNYSGAIEGNPSLFSAYWERALVEIKMDSIENSINDMGVYIESLRSKTSDQDKRILEQALIQRASVMLRLGYKSDCCQDLRDACDLNISSAPCEKLRISCK